MLTATTYTFEELPLAIEGDYIGLFAQGVADIECFRDGRWRIAGIKLQVARYELGKMPVYKLAPAPKPIAQIIELTLLSNPDWHHRVQDRVEEALRANVVEDIEDFRVIGAYRRQVEM